jgi:outer membrane protein
MRIYRLIAAFVMLAAIAVVPAYAQQRPAAAPQAPAGAGSSGPLPDSKIAVIFTEAFLDEKQGIARFNTLVANLNREFQPRETELQGLKTRAQALQDEITKTASVADPKTIQTKTDQLESLKKELQRKAEDAQSAFVRRRKEIFQPLQEDIGKALEAYAKQRGISVIIDGSQVPLVYAADNLDITRAFIAEYNAKNPATASAR